MRPAEFRRAVRSGEWTGPTAACCPGFVQANLVIVPQSLERYFTEFCRSNPKPCPLLEKTDAGSFYGPAIAPDADLRTDVPKYRVYHFGALESEPTNLLEVWREDLVSFLLGCSFTFDGSLQRAGVEVRHIAEGKNVPMYVTNRSCVPAGPFSGPLVVSMRPIKEEHVGLVSAISGDMPLAHGAPVHVGDPKALGIDDLTRPEFGDAVTIEQGEVPVFWACGTTPQVVVRGAKPELMITHAPGHMFVTDLSEAELGAWAERAESRSNSAVVEER